MQKHLNIEKIIFKVVQIKLLAMHINNKKLRFVSSDRESDELYLSHTIIQSIMCSLHLTHPSAHTPGAVGGSVPCSRVSPQSVDTSCQSRDSNPQASGYKSNARSIRPRLPFNSLSHTHTHTHTHTLSLSHVRF